MRFAKCQSHGSPHPVVPNLGLPLSRRPKLAVPSMCYSISAFFVCKDSVDLLRCGPASYFLVGVAAVWLFVVLDKLLLQSLV